MGEVHKRIDSLRGAQLAVRPLPIYLIQMKIAILQFYKVLNMKKYKFHVGCVVNHRNAPSTISGALLNFL